LNGGEPQYINDLLIPILKDTYGVIIYQEQITEIASKIGGFPLSEAEIIRRVVSKSKGSNVLEEYRDKFVYGGMNNRVDKDEGNLIWDVIREAGAYSFNKSHAVEYSVITYWCAWLKTYYPKEFLIALMQFEEDVILNNAVLELRSLSHDVGVPDINKSLEDVSLDSEGNILFGLSDIKHVGQKAIDDILEKRPFESFEDFMDRRDTRVTNTRVIKHLIQAGAFDKFGRRDEFYYQVAVDETPHEWNDKEMTLMQVEVLEMPPKKPISDFYKNPFKEVSITPIEEIDWEESLDEVYVKGTITSYKEKEGYAYLNVHDGTGTANVLLSEEQINLYRDKIPLDEGVITIILKAHTVEGKTTLYSDMMVNLEDLDPYKYEREIDYMENGRKETMHHLQTSQGIKERLGVVVTSFYFLSKKGNKGCRIVFDNGDRLMSFGRLQEPIVPGQIIRYKISKSPFIEVLERW
jgi:DNA polymerase III alpha subunit